MKLGVIYPSQFNQRQYSEFHSVDQGAERDMAPGYDPDAEARSFYDGDDKYDLADGRAKQSEPGRFVWETDDGDLYFLSEMATSHLFYALRMLFNHTVPPAFRVGWCTKNRHENVFGWPLDYKEQAIRKIFHELTEHRTDLEDWQQCELNDMIANAEAIVELGL